MQSNRAHAAQPNGCFLAYAGMIAATSLSTVCCAHTAAIQTCTHSLCEDRCPPVQGAYGSMPGFPPPDGLSQQQMWWHSHHQQMMAMPPRYGQQFYGYGPMPTQGPPGPHHGDTQNMHGLVQQLVQEEARGSSPSRAHPIRGALLAPAVTAARLTSPYQQREAPKPLLGAASMTVTSTSLPRQRDCPSLCFIQPGRR